MSRSVVGPVSYRSYWSQTPHVLSVARCCGHSAASPLRGRARSDETGVAHRTSTKAPCPVEPRPVSRCRSPEPCPPRSVAWAVIGTARIATDERAATTTARRSMRWPPGGLGAREDRAERGRRVRRPRSTIGDESDRRGRFPQGYLIICPDSPECAPGRPSSTRRPPSAQRPGPRGTSPFLPCGDARRDIPPGPRRMRRGARGRAGGSVDHDDALAGEAPLVRAPRPRCA